MPVPILLPTLLPSPTIPLDRRDTYTTATVIASDAATSVASTKSSAFPFAVAIPALVGGMVLAVGAFWFWWWMSKRKKRERRERWERAQRRKRNKANAQPRPSVSSHSGPKSSINEKEYASIIPSLPKQSATSPTYASNQAQNPFAQSQSEYAAFAPGYPTAPQQGYTTQPYIDQDQHQRGYTYDQYGNAVPLTAGTGTYQYTPTPPEPTPSPAATPAAEPSPKTGKRAAARMAVAETAAANASVDPAYRHKPNKPSPLALKAAADAAAAAEKERENERKSTGFRIQPELAAQLAYEAQEEEMLAPEQQHQMYDNGNGQSLGYDLPQNQGQRQVSGEWGVALGSPNNDGSFAQQQNFSNGQAQSGYSHDPYLQQQQQQQQQQQRAVSGQYTVDPYAVYHGGEKKEKGQSWL